MSKVDKLTEEEKKRLVEGIKKCSSKYLFNSKNVKDKSKK